MLEFAQRKYLPFFIENDNKRIIIKRLRYDFAVIVSKRKPKILVTNSVLGAVTQGR